MKLNRNQRRIIRNIRGALNKGALLTLKGIAYLTIVSIITLSLILTLKWLATFNDNREWTYGECTWTYRHSHPDKIARECNHLKDNN